MFFSKSCSLDFWDWSLLYSRLISKGAFQKLSPRSLGMMICLKTIYRSWVFHKKGSLWINSSTNTSINIYKIKVVCTNLPPDLWDWSLLCWKALFESFHFYSFPLDLWESRFSRGVCFLYFYAIYIYIYIFVYLFICHLKNQPFYGTHKYGPHGTKPKTPWENTKMYIHESLDWTLPQRTNFWKHVFLVF